MECYQIKDLSTCNHMVQDLGSDFFQATMYFRIAQLIDLYVNPFLNLKTLEYFKAFTFAKFPQGIVKNT